MRFRWGRYPVCNAGCSLVLLALSLGRDDYEPEICGYGKTLALEMLLLMLLVLIGVFWHKIAPPLYVPDIHLLVDYHFGFTKRA